MFEGNPVIYTVIIEFDGQTDSKSRYYRRLHAMGLYARGGTKDQSVLGRRSSFDDRIIVQEATVTCVSESLARYVAHTAQDCGAAAVVIITGQVKDGLYKTREDAGIINQVEKKAEKRGRKPAPRTWVCTCKECLTQTEQGVSYVMNCGNCGGLRFSAREGSINRYRDPGGDVLMAWALTRFATGEWEPCLISDKALSPPSPLSIKNTHAHEEKIVRVLPNSPDLSVLMQMERENAFSFLDAMFVSRAYDGPEQRAERRVRTITEFMIRGGDASTISFLEPTEPDLIDAAALGVGKVAGWLLQGGVK